MVYIRSEDGIERKYACTKCIKGHRSSKCTHTDRELFEIKRKGRPVSQCETCRLLRKTRHVHTKCTCASKASNSRKGLHHPTANLDIKHELSEASASPDLSPLNSLENPLIRSTSCLDCQRPKLYCNCKRTTVLPGGSEGSITPPAINLPSITSITTPPAGLNRSSLPSSPRRPIHDPTDDIDSDTPIYKPVEEAPVNLGGLTNMSSDELMNRIYSGFNPSSSSSSLLEAEDDTLMKLSRDD